MRGVRAIGVVAIIGGLVVTGPGHGVARPADDAAPVQESADADTDGTELLVAPFERPIQQVEPSVDWQANPLEPEPVETAADAPLPPFESMGAIPLAVTEGVDDAWTAGQIRQRLRFGLPATLDAVEAARDGGEATDEVASLVLTSDEREVVLAQLDFQHRMDDFIPGVLKAAGADYAGSYYSAGADLRGKFTVLVYRSSFALEQLPADQLPDELRSRVEIRPGSLPYDYLVAVQSDIHDRFTDAGIRSQSALDEVRGRIEVVVEAADAEAARAVELPSQIAELVNVHAGELGEPLEAKNTMMIYGMLEGGLSMEHWVGSGAKCTSGFIVYSWGYPFLMSAGHCYHVPNSPYWYTDWYQGTATIGSVAAATVPATGSTGANSVDAMLLGPLTRPGVSRVHVTTDDSWRPVKWVSGSRTPGSQVCNSGAESNFIWGWSSPQRCGGVFSTNWCSDNGCGYIGSDMYACHGDSGATMYQAIGADAQGEGMVHASIWWPAGNNCGWGVAYTWLPNALSYYGATLAPW